MTDDLVGRGLPMFLPAGYTVWQELENYIKEKERARGYLHVMTPCIGTVNLYKTSGHWDHYRENMFPAMEMEGESYVCLLYTSCVNRRCGQTGSSPTRCRESRPGAPGAASGLPCPETLPPQSAEANLCRVCPLQHSEWRGFFRPHNSGGTVERC